MEKEYCTNDKQMNEICRHGTARANGDGQEEKPATGTSSNLLRDGDYSTTCQETKSTGKNEGVLCFSVALDSCHLCVSSQTLRLHI